MPEQKKKTRKVRVISQRELTVASVKVDGNRLKETTAADRNDRELVELAIRHSSDGSALMYASKELRGDRDICQLAMEYSVFNLAHCSLELRSDPDLVLSAVRKKAEVIRYAAPELYGHAEIMLEVLRQLNEDSFFSRYVALSLLKNRDFCLQAVAIKGLVLKQVSPEMQGDLQVVLAAVRNCGKAMEFASPEMRNTKEVVLEAIRKDSLCLKYASVEMRSTVEVVLKAIRDNSATLQYAAPKVKNNAQVVLEAVQDSGNLLCLASAELQANYEVVLAAVRNCGSALRHAAPELQGNRDIVLEAMKSSNTADIVFQYASEELRGNYCIVLEAVLQHGAALAHAAPHLQKNPWLVQVAIRTYGDALQYAGADLQNDPETVGAAIRGGMSLNRPDSLYFRELFSRQAPNIGYQLLERLESAVQHLEQKQKQRQQQVTFDSADSVRDYAIQWRKSIPETKWLLGQVLTKELPLVLEDMILEMIGMDLKEEWKGAADLEYCAPVLGALAERNASWTDVCSRWKKEWASSRYYYGMRTAGNMDLAREATGFVRYRRAGNVYRAREAAARDMDPLGLARDMDRVWAEMDRAARFRFFGL